MSDVTRQPDGTPVGPQTTEPSARGADAAPGLRTDGEVHPRSTDGTATRAATPAATTPVAADGGELLPHDECDKLGQRLQHAVAGFVDAPRASVEEADRVLEELTARFTDAVAHRRSTLRTSWHDTDPDDRATSTDTEQLRLALRDYRELADRLMRL
ncbi:hypothetical protein ACFUAC_00670 [Streptomyces sp. NPDC057148]|uniref:hypothetical protein n=1 Tax=unclassified Streptomyces TaxID=2593676 RepID=UPI00363DB1F9